MAGAAEAAIGRSKSEYYPNRRAAVEKETSNEFSIEFQRRRLLSTQHRSEEMNERRRAPPQRDPSCGTIIQQQQWLLQQLGEIEHQDTVDAQASAQVVALRPLLRLHGRLAVRSL